MAAIARSENQTGQEGEGQAIGKPGRRKRGSYVSKACIECKKRKSKCEGTQPCARCTKSGLRCTFLSGRGLPRQDEQAETRRLREKVAILERMISASTSATAHHEQADSTDTHTQTASTLLWLDEARQASDRQGADEIVCNAPPTQPCTATGILPTTEGAATAPHVPPDPPYLGDPPLPNNTAPGRQDQAVNEELPAPAANHPSWGSSGSSCPMDPPLPEAADSTHMQSTAHYKFNLGLAQTRLQSQGLSPHAPHEILLTTRSTSCVVPDAPSGRSVELDPIWHVSRQEAVRLCNVYEEEIGISYPFLEIAEVLRQTHSIFDVLEAGTRNGFGYTPLRDNTSISLHSLRIVKMVLATALIIESSGSSTLGRALFHHVRDSCHDMMWGPVHLHCITVYTLFAIWEFLADNDSLAWRLTGVVARWCLELGLNQALCVRKLSADLGDQTMIIRLFWCIHTLDRRWSFGSGLPFVIQDADIDQELPEPDDNVPYLKAMVSFSRIVSVVWYASYGKSSTRPKQDGIDEIAYLDFRISRWWEDLPVSLQYGKGVQAFSRGWQRLRILLYLRKCQLKILLHQSVLHSAARINEQLHDARLVVDLAKDTIQTLATLDRTTNIYQTQQMCFNHFLVLALGVVFLAVSQAPGEFAVAVRCEFNTALDLVQSLSSSSFVSKRLWRTIRGLRHFGDKLGVSREHGLLSNPEAMNQSLNNCDNGALDQHPTVRDSDFPVTGDQDVFFFTDDQVDGFQLTEDMSAVFDAMENQFNPLGNQQGSSALSNGDSQHRGAPFPESTLPAFTSGTIDTTRLLLGMMGRS